MTLVFEVGIIPSLCVKGITKNPFPKDNVKHALKLGEFVYDY
jgi:hypothetical protein